MTAPKKVPCSSQRNGGRYRAEQANATLPPSLILQDLASRTTRLQILLRILVDKCGPLSYFSLFILQWSELMPVKCQTITILPHGQPDH